MMTSRTITFHFLIFILIFHLHFAVVFSQENSECLEIAASGTIPSEIVEVASNIIVGYRSTGTFEPIRLSNLDNVNHSLHPIELQYSEDGLIGRYTNIELSPNHQRILQIFSDEADDLILRISSEVEGNIESIEVDRIPDGGFDPVWINSNTILTSINRNDGSIYSYTILSLENMTIETLSFDLSLQPTVIEQPQLSPDLSHLLFRGRETTTKIYIYSDATKITIPVTESMASSIGLQWSPQGNYISFFSDVKSSSALPQNLTIVNSDGELIIPRELSYGEPIVYPSGVEIVWSPDENYFAYQNQSITFRGQIGSKTSIVEIDSQTTLEVCVPGTLFWSPNSKYAGIFSRTPPSSSPPNEVIGLFVIDINSKEIYEIPIDNMEDITLEIGWIDIVLDS